jgi:hypothetical protein
MPPLQFGIDIATSLSVIGTTIVFIVFQFRQAKKSRAHAVRQQRIENMSRLISDFSTILLSGDKIVNLVRQAQAGHTVTITANDYTNFCADVDRYIRINSALLFEVWATPAEKKSIAKINELVHDWNKSFVAAALERSNGKISEVPSFDELIADLTKQLTAFSSLLKAEIEAVVT